MTSTCARRDHVIRTPRVVVAQRAHARARRACARVDHVTHAHLRTCASQSRDARRTTALRRTTASWRSTASRCVTLDPALGATTSAALCALAVQRARAHARVDHVIHAHLRTCASQSRDARRTSALRRATASWRSTASRCTTFDPALDATTSAALCALVVQRARARARGENARRHHAVDGIRAHSTCARAQVKAATHDGFATHDGLVTPDGLAVRDVRPRARRDHIGCALHPRRSTRTRSRSRRERSTRPRGRRARLLGRARYTTAS